MSSTRYNNSLSTEHKSETGEILSMIIEARKKLNLWHVIFISNSTYYSTLLKLLMILF